MICSSREANCFAGDGLFQTDAFHAGSGRFRSGIKVPINFSNGAHARLFILLSGKNTFTPTVKLQCSSYAKSADCPAEWGPAR